MPWTFVKSSPEPLTVQPSNRMSPVQPMKCVASAMVLKTRPDRSVGHDVEADHRNVVRTDAEDAAAQRVMDRHLLDAGLPAVDDFDTVGDVASVEKDDDGSRGGFHGRAVVETHPVVPQVGDPGPEHVAAQRYVACLVEQFVRRAVVEVRVFGDDPLQAVFSPRKRESRLPRRRDSVRRRSPYLNRCPLPRRSSPASCRAAASRCARCGASCCGTPRAAPGFISPWKIQSHPPPSISTSSVRVRAKTVVGLAGGLPLRIGVEIVTPLVETNLQAPDTLVFLDDPSDDRQGVPAASGLQPVVGHPHDAACGVCGIRFERCREEQEGDKMDQSVHGSLFRL